MPKPKPLISETYTAPQALEFKHFGVLNTGTQSKSSLFTSVTLNVILVILALIVGAAAKKTIEQHKKEDLTFVTPLKETPPEPPKPPLPKPLMPKPPVVKPIVEPPKIVKPEVKLPDPPKPMPVKMPDPAPVMKVAPPKVVVAASAPAVVAVKMPSQSAAVVNHDLHPSEVRLGTANNPLVPSDRPAVASAVNLGRQGQNGMPASNIGAGRPTAVNLGGNGQPNGSLNGGGRVAVVGVPGGIPHGQPGSNGNATGTRPAQVSLAQNQQPAAATQVVTAKPVVRSGPQVIFKPKPVYTAEATAMHLEGTVSVSIHVAASGAVSVVGVTSGLGHGLDESAIRAIQGTRFKPAVDASGNPTDWDGVVKVSFQLAG